MLLCYQNLTTHYRHISDCSLSYQFFIDNWPIISRELAEREPTSFSLLCQFSTLSWVSIKIRKHLGPETVP